MKNTMFAMAALSVVMLAGCSSQDEELQSSNTGVPYTATVEANGSTRAYNADGKGTFSWSEGDNITAYDGSAFQEMTMTGGAGTADATYASPSWIPREVAVFPISALKSYSGGVLTVNYPTTRAIASGQAIESANVDDPLVAYFNAGAKHFNFLHVGGVMEFETVLPTGATSFTVTLDKGITGDFTVNDADKTNPTVEAAESDGSNNTVTFTFDPVSEDNGYMVFLLPVPTGTYASMKVTASDGTNETSLSNTMENTVERCDWLKFTLNMSEYTSTIEAVTERDAQGNLLVASADALTKAINGGEEKIKLTEDVSLSSQTNISQGTTIDLNGKTLTVKEQGSNYSDININTTEPISIKNGTVDLGPNCIYQNENTNVTVDNATINSTYQPFIVGYMSSSNSQYDSYNSNKLTIKNSTINSEESAIIIYNHNNEVSIENSNITTNWFGITQNGTKGPGSTITLKDTNITSKYSGIYLSSNANATIYNTLTIEGGTITSNEESAIEVKKTNVTVTGATLVSKATTQSYSVKGGGSNAIGYGIALVGYVTGTAYEGTTSFSNNQFTLGYTGSDAIKIGKYDGTSLVKVE